VKKKESIETRQTAAIDRITGASPVIESVKRLIHQVAGSDITVLITGESGTGKELVAEAIHSLSRRRSGPMVAINCGAIPEGIFESEIFGHEKGSFTSADRNRRGYFEMAHQGTLFLDEIGEMPLSVQVKILRVLETNRFLKVGGTEEVSVDVRVIAATNKDLSQESAKGTFRQDLYYRLKAVNIHLPPLRERPEDIPLLVEQFAREFSERNNRPAPRFNEGSINILKRGRWQGNVRELKNFIESLIALSASSAITEQDITTRLSLSERSSNLPMVISRSPEELDRELLYRTLLELRSDMNQVKGLLRKLVEEKEFEFGTHFAHAEEAEAFSLDEMEREQIRRALQEFNGNRRLAAKALGIGERTLYRKIQRFEL